MIRYIDAEWIRNVYADFKDYEGRDDWTTPISNVLAVIDDAPSIDIVRCKECKWAEPNREGDLNCKCHIPIFRVSADDFCSNGERKEKCKECWYWSEVHKRCENKCGCQFKLYGEMKSDE